MQVNKEEIDEWLHNEILTITFIKVSDNTERQMICTLLPKYLPERFSEPIIVKSDNPNLMKVFDLDNNAWRSFRIDRIIEIKEGIYEKINR